MKIAEKVFETIKPLFTGNIKLVDVEYVKKSDGMHLCVYIDKESGITIDDCSFVNGLINDAIETLNPTNDASYFLDVSSYGLDKPLKFDWQFEKYYNKLVDVKLYRTIDGRKEFTAILINKTSNDVQLEVDKTNVTLNIKDVAYILPHIDF